MWFRRRLVRYLIIITIILLRFVFVNAVLFTSANYQSFLLEKAVKYFSEHYSIKLSIKDFDVKLPDRIILDDIYLKDQNNDTILFTDNLTGRLSGIKIRPGRLYINEVTLNKPVINVEKDSAGNFNFHYILEQFASDKKDKDKKGDGIDLYCETFDLKNAVIKYKDAPFQTTPGYFNSSDILVDGFNISVSDFGMHNDSIRMMLNELSFKEKSGFTLQNMSGFIHISDTLYRIEDFYVKTEHSALHAPVLEMAYLEKEKLNIWEDLKFNVEIDSSFLCLRDAGYFSNDFKGLEQNLKMSAKFNGVLSNLKLKDFNLSYLDETIINADIRINGLPEFENSFVFADINKLSTSVDNVEQIYLPPFNKEQTIEVPESLQKVGKITFSGNITGMFYDLVADGLFETSAGNITTDLAVTNNAESGKLNFNGKLSVKDLKAGKLLQKEEMLGVINMGVNLTGYVDTLGRYDFRLSSEVNKAEVYNYPYKNISLAGHLTNKSFNGEVMIKDSNLNFEFMGGYQMGNGIPEMDFRADFRADPYQLNLDTTPSEVGFLMIADFRGNEVNNLSGNLKLSNTFLRRTGDSLNIEKFNIKTGTKKGEHFININSDILEFESTGDYNLKYMSNKLAGLIFNYLPVLDKREQKKEDEYVDPGYLRFEADFKNLSEITSFIMPGLRIKEGMSFKGDINANKDKYIINGQVGSISYDTLKINNLKFDLLANSRSLGLNIGAEGINQNKNQYFEGLKIETLTQNDSVQLGLDWDNKDSVRYAGDLNLSLDLNRSVNDNIALNTHVYPSDFIIKNQEWKLNESDIMIDTTEIHVDNLKFHNEKQMIRLNGNVSQDENEDIRYFVDNFDISVINPFIKSSGYKLKGRFNSNGRLSDAYGDLDFRTFLELDDLYINQEEFGRVQINSKWDNYSNAIKIDGNSRYINFRGEANPVEDTVNMALNINNFGLNVIEPYMNKAGLLDVRGRIDGNINVMGSLSDPDVKGALDFDRAGLTYDLLMARFNLDDTVFVYSDSLVFNKFRITDEKGNKGFIEGKLTHNKFNNIKYDFDISIDNYHILNTTEVDNSTYYGSAYADASANIKGGTENININITQSETQKNTVFVLPMTDSYEADNDPWITFINDTVSDESIKDIVPESNFGVNFNMNIDVTPEAEARIVFDPKVGDMIKANCDGNLSIKVTPDTDFAMKGELEVEGGDYLFTLQNVINKRFVLEEGGTISWDGDPLEGKLDINAAYKLKAPLYDIMMGIDTSDVYKRRTDVHCMMEMTGKISNPDIKFDIKVPNADEKAKTRIASLTPDEINKQVLTLLVLNRFYTPDDMQVASAESRGANIAGVTSFELLSNQLSNWLSQISDDFDIGVNYRPGDEITSQELEVALSTQLLNDRVLINGNFGVGEHRDNTSDIVGDVEVQVKVNESGNLRVKGFTRANVQNQMGYDYGPYTQGVGLFYTESFSSLKSLFRRYLRSIGLINDKKNKKAKKDIK